jgi:alpha-L-arabinofuranosidase
VYHWQNNSITLGRGYINPNNTFDAFMGGVHQIDAWTFITVNYGSNAIGTDGGDPIEAAAWVRYANNIKRYGIIYWEIGNEVYGNGTYSSKWEADLHALKGSVTYADNVLQFVNFMKGVDSSIKVGVALIIPIDSRSNNGERQMADWNKTVLSIACSQIDFVDIHWYSRWHEGDSSDLDAMLLARTSQIPDIMSQLRLQISQYCGTHAKAVQILSAKPTRVTQASKQLALSTHCFSLTVT